MRHIILPVLLGTAFIVSGCQTVPEAEEEEVVVLAPEVVETCTEMSALTRVVIPAKEEIYYAITMIDNPPYAPIERKEKLTRIVEPEQVFYEDSMGAEVTDICDPDSDPGAEEVRERVEDEPMAEPETVPDAETSPIQAPEG